MRVPAWTAPAATPYHRRVPIYEYRCGKCGRITEVMQKASDPPPARCPGCGGRRLAKVVSRTAFQLKGGGWYADLYGAPRRNQPGKKEPEKKPEKKETGRKEPGASPAPGQKPGGSPAKKAAGKGS